MMNLTSEQIDCAVDWWANDLVQGRKFQMFGKEGPSTESEAMTNVFGQVAFAKLKPEVTDEQRDAFKSALKMRLKADKLHNHHLGVDYDPCLVLAESLEEAGLRPSFALSIKTGMWFEKDGSVVVRHGYGAEFVTLLSGNSEGKE